MRDAKSFLSTKEAADYLGYADDSAIRWSIRKGFLDAVKIGNRWVVSYPALDRLKNKTAFRGPWKDRKKKVLKEKNELRGLVKQVLKNTSKKKKEE